MRSRRSAIPLPASPDTAQPTANYDRVDEVAGHRVVRRFSSGSQATLLLAASSIEGGQHSRLRMIKIFHPLADRRQIDTEISCLCAVDSQHVVRLIDLATLDPAAPPCLVLERLPGPTLAAYLDEHSVLVAGVAVSILAPLCAAIQCLHDAGVTHGDLQTRRVVFDEIGAPVLTGFGRGYVRAPSTGIRTVASTREEELRSASDLEWREARNDDVRALLGLVDFVLGRIAQTDNESRRIIGNLVASLGAVPSRQILGRLESELFSVAAAAPLDLSTVLSTHPVESEERTSTVGYPRAVESIRYPSDDWAIEVEPVSGNEPEPRIVAVLRILGAPPAVVDAACRTVASFSLLRHERRLPMPKSPRRRPLLIGVGSLAIVVAVLLLVLPTDQKVDQAGATVPRPSLASNASEAMSAEETTDVGILTDQEQSVLDGDDPAAALAVLQPGNGFETPPPIVTGRWGGSALVASSRTGQPVAFLLVKGEAGWRIRDRFDAGG